VARVPCINWRRTLPYLRGWADQYKEHALIVIGVHTPEFGFEKDLGNVGRETRALEIHYPVAVDSNYAIWLFEIEFPVSGVEALDFTFG
jgi:hypothetical protein